MQIKGSALLASVLSMVMASSLCAIDEPDLKSDKPLFFRFEFVRNPGKSMLGVMDETGGTGSGYNIVYLDKNMDGNLFNDPPQKFPENRGRNREVIGKFSPRFTVPVQISANRKAEIEIDLIRLFLRERGFSTNRLLTWRLELNGWEYLFINGEIGLYGSAEEAMKRRAVWLGGDYQWAIEQYGDAPRPVFAAGLKDLNNCTLRAVYPPASEDGTREVLQPHFSLQQNGATVLEKRVKFG